MTGYGRTEAGDEGSHISMEIRSLNNRYLDIQIKMPRGLAILESRVKKTIQERFSRGRFEVFISRDSEHARIVRLAVNENLVEQYVVILNELKARFGLAGDVDLSLVAGLADLITVTDEKDDPEALWPILSTAVSQALDDLDRMRSDEGALLAQDIRDRLTTIDRTSMTISTRAPVIIENARMRMKDSLSKLIDELPDPVRLAQEIAILAERTDVTEELTRLGSHLKQFRNLLDASPRESVGKKLDFLLQEMGREVNTIASKAMDAQIAMDVVNLKAELEKIREQVQNIE